MVGEKLPVVLVDMVVERSKNKIPTKKTTTKKTSEKKFKKTCHKKK